MRTTRTKSLTRSVIAKNQFEQMGANPVDRTQSNGWDIEVSHRTLGITVKRHQFSAKIRHRESAHEEFLTGFSTTQQAKQAADERVDLLTRRPELLKQGGKRKRPVLPNAVTWQRELTASLPKLPKKKS